MFKTFFSRAGLAAAAVAGVMALSLPAAEAKTNIGIWIGVPGFTYWNGPGYYRGVYRHWAGARFPETLCCATDRIDGGRAWTERMVWNRV